MNFKGIELPPAYYQDEWVYIIHGDCREILPLIPDKSIDLVLTDPPYGNSTDYKSYVDDKDNLNYLVSKVIPEVMRIASICFVTCGVANMWLYPNPTWVLSWVVPAGSGSGPWGFCCWQPVLAYGKDPYLANGKGRKPDTLVRYEKASNEAHPCAKPLTVWKWLISRGNIEGGLLLDPFLGSGTTAVASKHLNRYCIGIEIEEKYCEIAAKRCCQSVMELNV